MFNQIVTTFMHIYELAVPSWPLNSMHLHSMCSLSPYLFSLCTLITTFHHYHFTGVVKILYGVVKILYASWIIDLCCNSWYGVELQSFVKLKIKQKNHNNIFFNLEQPFLKLCACFERVFKVLKME